MPSIRRSSHASTAVLLAFTLAATALPANAGEPTREPAAVAIAERALDAMGGADAWAATRFLRFDFFGFRMHHWDRQTGRHRLEGKTRDGDAYVVVHDLDTREGHAWLNGEALAGEDLDDWLGRAWNAWINDTYWLLMPYKLLDPGVHLTHEGEESFDGTAYDKVKLTFDDGVGNTSGDTYWAWFDRESGLMDRWAYHLESWEADREPTAWRWTDWQSYGGIKLSSTRINVAEGGERGLGRIAVFDHLPDSAFTSPDAVAPAGSGE